MRQNAVCNLNRKSMDSGLFGKLKLHDAIVLALQTETRPMTIAEITDRVNKGGMYSREDGKPVPANQVYARIRNYIRLFTINRSIKPNTIALRNL